MKIVIVEDNEKIRDELKNLLIRYGYEVFAIERFENAIEDIISVMPHLVLLDINLPIYDGFYICRELRAKIKVPIIMVTSRDTDIDELMSMNLGADDFISKPYNTQILLARISNLLRRVYQVDNSEKYTYNNVTINLSKSSISYNNKEIELSKNELKILYLLMKNNQTIISRDEIMEELWQSDEFVDDNTLTVNINRLRKKLESIELIDFIRTKRGQGYLV